MLEIKPIADATLDRYWKGLVWTISTAICKVLIGIGTSIIFVRYLGDTGYASVVVMADFITLCIVCLSMGLGVVQTRVLPQLFAQEQYGKVKNFVLKTFGFRIIASIVVSLAIYPNASLLVNTLYPGIPAKLIVIALLLLPVQMIGICLRGTLEATFHQKVVGVGELFGLGVHLVLVIPVVIFDLGILWFFFTQVCADICLAIFYGINFYSRIWKIIKHARKEVFTGKIWSLGIISMLTLLCNRFLGKEVDTQILSFRLHEAGLPEIAFYSISFMLVSRSLSFIGVGSGGVNNLNQSIMAHLVEVGDIDAIRKTYSNLLQIFYFISIPLMFGSFVFAEPALVLMYGNSFIGSGNICAVLFLGLGGTVITYITYPIIFAFGFEKKLLKGRASFGCLNVVLSFYLASFGAIGVASATGLCLLGIGLYESFILDKLIAPKYPLGFFIKVLIGSTVMALIAFGTYKSFSFDVMSLNILGGITAGVFSFYAMMYILKPFCKKDIKNWENLPKVLALILSKLAA